MKHTTIDEGGDGDEHAVQLNLNLQEDDLCCCEYINKNGYTSHLLAICCDCDILDDSFERLIQREEIPNSHFYEIYSVLSDRLRIPWYKGARKINLLGVAPFLLLPILGYLSTFGPFSTAISFLVIPIILRLLCKYLGNARTKFYYSFTLASLFYNFLVVYTASNTWSLYISNIGLFISILIGISIIKWKCRKDVSLVVDNLPFYYYCRKCRFHVIGRDHHCNWLDCCIGLRNRRYFIFTIILTISWLLVIIYYYYGIFYGVSAIPVYTDFFSGISFVTTIYGSVAVVCLFPILIHQLNMTWKGMSYLDWKFKKTLE